MSAGDRMLKAEEAGKYCECCGYFPVETKDYPNTWTDSVPGAPKKFRFCEFCANTMAGNTVIYDGSRSSETTETLQAMGWSHNRLMAEIRGER